MALHRRPFWSQANVRQRHNRMSRLQTVMDRSGLGMKKQPNFTDVFFQYFASRRDPVVYELRPDANFRHDLAFVSSLLHDARILRVNKRSRRRYEIAVERDRWEVSRDPGDPNATPVLSAVESMLICSPVNGLVYTQTGDCDVIEPERTIDYIWVTEAYFDCASKSFELVLGGQNWRICIELPKFEFSIRLKDLTRQTESGSSSVGDAD